MLDTKVIFILALFVTVAFSQEDRLGKIVNKLFGNTFDDVKNIKDFSTNSTVLFSSNVFKQNSNASIDLEESSSDYEPPLSAYEYGGDSYKREVKANSKDNKLDSTVDKLPSYGSEPSNSVQLGTIPPHLSPLSVLTDLVTSTTSEKPFEVVTNAYDARPRVTSFETRANAPSIPSDANLNESIIDQLKEHFGKDHVINKMPISDLTKSALYNSEIVDFLLKLNMNKNSNSEKGRTLADADLDNINESYENDGSDETEITSDDDDSDIESEFPSHSPRFKASRKNHFHSDEDLEDYDTDFSRSPRRRMHPFRSGIRKFNNRPTIDDYNDYEYEDEPTRNFRRIPGRGGSPLQRRLSRDEIDVDYEDFQERTPRRKLSRRISQDYFEDSADYEELPRRRLARPFTCSGRLCRKQKLAEDNVFRSQRIPYRRH